MARLARVVMPGVPHHVTQRGNRRLPTFFCPDDYAHYLDLLREWAPRCEGTLGLGLAGVRGEVKPCAPCGNGSR